MKTNLALRRRVPGVVGERRSGGVAITVVLLGLTGLLAVALALALPGVRADGLFGKGGGFWMAAPLATTPITALEGEERHPGVDYNPQIDSYLVVWEDYQMVYSITGVVVGVDGIPRDDPFYVSNYSPKKSLAPEVACNTQTGECLVVWEFAYEENVDHDIIARRVGNNGVPVGNEIIITASRDYETSPSVAYNPSTDEWLVVWDRAYDVHNRDIEAAVLDASGSVQARFTVASGLDDQANPSVAYGSNYGEYLAVWEDLTYTSENLNLVAQRVTSDGSLVGGVIPITTWEYEQVNPELDYNPDLDEFMVVWEDHHWAWGATADIYGQRVSADGTSVGGNFGISWEDGNRRLNPDIAYKPETLEYLVTWEYEYTPSDHDVYQRRVSGDGQLPSSEAPISNENSWEGLPVLASGSELAFLIVWEDYRNQATQNADIYGDVFIPVSPPTTETPTVTPTLKPSLTPTPTSTSTPTPTPTPTATSTPTPTPTPTATPKTSLDLQIEAIELTQGIQCKGNSKCKDGDNAVPLISGKATYVRVYVKVIGSTSPVPDVSASALAYVGYNQYTGVPLNSPISAPLIPDRAKFSDTLNFYFSASELSASGTIKVTVNPDHKIPESTYANNSKTVPVAFVHTPPLKIVPIWVHYKWGNHSSYVNLDMPWWLNNYTENILPVGEVYWLNMPGSMLEWTEKVGPGVDGWDKLLAKIRDLRNKNIWWSYLSGPIGFAQFYGMFPFGQQEGPDSAAGLGDDPGWVAVGLVEMTHQNLEDCADILVHELGHNFDRSHAPCDVTDPDPNYPYSNAELGDYGWDPQGAAGGKVQSLPDGWVVPQTSSDVMSYCQDEWISEYTYRGILDYRGSTLASGSNLEEGMMAPVSAGQETWSYLFVSGNLSDTLALDPWSILEFPSGYHSQPGEGAYALRLVDAARQTLFTRYFDMQKSMPSWLPGAPAAPTVAPLQSFYEIVPWYPTTAYVEIWHGDTMLVERATSPSTPVVALLGPMGGETWKAGGDYTISWVASDADGDPLWFDVAFSQDGGENWAVIATHHQGTSLQVRGDQFPGTSQALVRVYASDGLLTSQATSGFFNIEAKGPTVLITLPGDGMTVSPNMPLMLTGYAFDWEDGPLSGDSLAWSSDREGFLGSGNQIWANLSPGWHAITLTVIDSDGMTASATIHLYLGYKIHLPLVRR